MGNPVQIFPIIQAAQAFTGSWVDLGGDIPVAGYSVVKLWLDFDVNDSLNMRVRVLPKLERGGSADEYNAVIETIGTSDVKVEPAYWELNVDSDQKLVFTYVLDDDINFVQVQISAGTAGASPGQIVSAQYTLGWK